MSDEQLLRVKKMTLETEDNRICVGLIPTGIELKRVWIDRVRDFWAPPFGRRRLGAAVWARGHLGAGRLGAGRLGAVIVLLEMLKVVSNLIIIGTYQLIKTMRVSLKSKLEELK